MKQEPLCLPQTPTGLRSANKVARFGMLRTVYALMLREMSASYGRSPGGYIWALGEPILGIALMSVIFSLGFRSPSLGSNFPIYFATGMLPFMMFINLANKISQSINHSKQLLSYPRVTFVDAVIARFILNLLTQLLVSYIVLTGILMAFETRTTFEIDRIFLAYCMVASLGLGVGIFNCFLMSLFPIWQQIYGILTRPLVLMSGVIFLYDNIPNPYRGYLWYNPLIHITGEMRGAFYKSYDAPYVSPVYVFVISAILITVGLLFLWRFYRDILEM